MARDPRLALGRAILPLRHRVDSQAADEAQSCADAGSTRLDSGFSSKGIPPDCRSTGMVHRSRRSRVVAVLVFSLLASAPAQEAGKSKGMATRLIRIADTFRPADGTPAAPVESVTFAIYAEEKGGNPLWLETQNVAIGAEGRYAALLG